VHGLRDRQHLADDRFFSHHEIAKRVSGRRSNQADVNRKRSIEKPRFPGEFNSLNQVARRVRVQPASVEFRIDERAEADVRNASRPAGGDVPEKLADDSLWKNDTFHLTGNRHLAELRNEAPVTADGPFQKPAMSQVVQSAIRSVSLTGRIKQGEVARLASFQKSIFDGRRE
jgi:hypothetical protein